VVFAGRSDRAIAMDLFGILGIEPTPENWRRFCRGYVEMLDETLPTHDGHVLPGVPELLAALSARGDVAVGLLTGNIREAARRKLSFYQLWRHFPFGGFGDEFVERNDIAAAALAAAHGHVDKKGDFVPTSLHPAPSPRLVVIGDTLHDIRCGQSIGATCVAVATGHSTSDVLRTAGPDVVVETLEDQRPILSLFDDGPPQT
jgi:phosphoglycolate phosphatase-like HAD superfamily hydrolase